MTGLTLSSSKNLKLHILLLWVCVVVVVVVAVNDNDEAFVYKKAANVETDTCGGGGELTADDDDDKIETYDVQDWSSTRWKWYDVIFVHYNKMDGCNDDCACCWCVAAADYAWYKLVMFKIVVLFSLSSAGNCGVNTDSF